MNIPIITQDFSDIVLSKLDLDLVQNTSLESHVVVSLTIPPTPNRNRLSISIDN